MGNIASFRFAIPNPDDFVTSYTVNKNIPQRVITTDLSKIDARQQWQIIFDDSSNDPNDPNYPNIKKVFNLKNIHNNTYLYIAQEPTEGVASFTTIDLENDNYKVDPAFIYLTDEELKVRTQFVFISSFGTQLDVIDSAKDEITNKKNMLNSVSATRVRLIAQKGQIINLFGVFIYSSSGKVLNIKPEWAYSSSTYESYVAGNAIKVVTENPKRKASDAVQNIPLNGKSIGWNIWSLSSQYCSHTHNPAYNIGGDDWWEYEFDNIQDISMIEFFGRNDCCPERYANMGIYLYNDKNSRTLPVWSGKSGDANVDAHKIIKII